MSDATKGVLAMVVACTVWGLSPIYYGYLSHVPAPEILSYRAIWSLAFFAAVLLVQRRLGLLFAALAQPRQAGWIALAGVVIGLNWLGFIHAVSTGRATESSLGYYIFPLVAVALGGLFLKERLRPAQWVAVALAVLAVLVLTVGQGAAPWIALGLGVSFGLYGLIKARLVLGPVVSVTAEVLLLAPLAVVWIAVAGTGAGGGNAIGTHLLLALSGPLTGMPLILFSLAARRVRLSTLGLVQYLNPTLQFLCAMLWFAEPFSVWHAIAFPLIWVALAIYSVTALRQERAARRARVIPV